jgi:NAD(P)-dependent dehydrogenase (short-subunit alcohol dehydrogenase family)
MEAEIVMEANMKERLAGRVALVAGATGLVGREILATILADETYVAVHGVGRRAVATTNPKPDKPEPNRVNSGAYETDCKGAADGNAH